MSKLLQTLKLNRWGRRRLFVFDPFLLQLHVQCNISRYMCSSKLILFVFRVCLSFFRWMEIVLGISYLLRFKLWNKLWRQFKNWDLSLALNGVLVLYFLRIRKQKASVLNICETSVAGISKFLKLFEIVGLVHVIK